MLDSAGCSSQVMIHDEGDEETNDMVSSLCLRAYSQHKRRNGRVRRTSEQTVDEILRAEST